MAGSGMPALQGGGKMGEGLVEAIGREPAVRVKAAVLLAVGASQPRTARMCGVVSRTIWSWRREKDDFRRLVEELTVMRQAAMGVWRERPSWAKPEAGAVSREEDGSAQINCDPREGGTPGSRPTLDHDAILEVLVNKAKEGDMRAVALALKLAEDWANKKGESGGEEPESELERELAALDPEVAREVVEALDRAERAIRDANPQ